MQREIKRTTAVVYTFNERGEVEQIVATLPNEIKDHNSAQKYLTRKGIYGKVMSITEDTTLTFMDDELYMRLAVTSKEAAKDSKTIVMLLEETLEHYRAKVTD